MIYELHNVNINIKIISINTFFKIIKYNLISYYFKIKVNRFWLFNM